MERRETISIDEAARIKSIDAYAVRSDIIKGLLNTVRGLEIVVDSALSVWARGSEDELFIEQLKMGMSLADLSPPDHRNTLRMGGPGNRRNRHPENGSHNNALAPHGIQPWREDVPNPTDVKAQAVKIASGLYPHQVEGVAFLMGRRRAILADDMGLGKTRQAIIAATHLQPDGPYLVVCPASVKQNWVREIEAVEPDADTAIVGPKPPPALT